MAAFLMAIIASILTILLSLPQVIGTYKNKNSQGVSLVSFWILLVGSSLWFVWGSLFFNRLFYQDTISQLTKLSLSFPVIANLLSATLIASTLTLLYRYIDLKNKDQIYIGIWSVLGVAIIISIIILKTKFSFPTVNNFDWGIQIIAILGGSGTAFAFLSQVFKSFKSRFIGQLTLGIILLGIVVNSAWAGYHIAIGLPLATYFAFALSLVGVLIYVVQLVSYGLYKNNKMPYVKVI